MGLASADSRWPSAAEHMSIPLRWLNILVLNPSDCHSCNTSIQHWVGSALDHSQVHLPIMPHPPDCFCVLLFFISSASDHSSKRYIKSSRVSAGMINMVILNLLCHIPINPRYLGTYIFPQGSSLGRGISTSHFPTCCICDHSESWLCRFALLSWSQL